MKMPKNITLKTKRLTLRKPRISDAKKILYIYQEKKLSTVTHIPYPYKLKDAQEFIKRNIKGFGKTHYSFFIVNNKTNEIMGSLGFVSVNKRDNHAEVGFVIAKKHRGKGYATEASQAIIDFGFKKLKFNRISIGHVKGNNASKGVIKKLGAKYEGTIRKNIRTADGKYRDDFRYGILAKEWKKK